MKAVLAVTIAAIVAIAIIHFSAPRPAPRHHIYFCMEPNTGLALPCMYRKNDPVDV